MRPPHLGGQEHQVGIDGIGIQRVEFPFVSSGEPALDQAAIRRWPNRPLAKFGQITSTTGLSWSSVGWLPNVWKTQIFQILMPSTVIALVLRNESTRSRWFPSRSPPAAASALRAGSSHSSIPTRNPSVSTLGQVVAVSLPSHSVIRSHRFRSINAGRIGLVGRVREEQRCNVVEELTKCSHTKPPRQLPDHLDAVVVPLKANVQGPPLQFLEFIAGDAVHLCVRLAEERDGIVHEL